jgi:hypothetical protein
MKRVDSAMNSECPLPFVSPSMREAVFTVSPMTVYSSRFCEPTFPAMNTPLLMPMPIWNGCSIPRSCSQVLKLASRGPSISCAAASARSAWSACSSGAPKIARIPSPR